MLLIHVIPDRAPPRDRHARTYAHAVLHSALATVKGLFGIAQSSTTFTHECTNTRTKLPAELVATGVLKINVQELPA
jgi:hypothetical protein